VHLRTTAFCRIRRQLLPFLISRPVFAGAGMVDHEGCLQLSDKAPAMNCVLGFGGMVFDRPIFTMGHFFKAMYAESWLSPSAYGRLFAAQQRLQISLGDSNMCEHAEYLRVGTTLLVLDAIEAGAIEAAPRVRRPVRALHAICRDPSLQATVPLSGRGTATALEIQRFYWAACRRFLQHEDEAPEEAWELLDHWGQTLDALDAMAEGIDNSTLLVGSLDWVTKRYILQHAGQDATWSERKKIDIRYHELSPAGYFEQLKATGRVPAVVSSQMVERARRSPPPKTPATMRGHFIREFSHGEQPIAVNWKTVALGSGWDRKLVDLTRYANEMRPGANPRSAGRSQNVGKNDL
jgi:proteasome accessory factor A